MTVEDKIKANIIITHRGFQVVFGPIKTAKEKEIIERLTEIFRGHDFSQKASLIRKDFCEFDFIKTD